MTRPALPELSLLEYTRRRETARRKLAAGELTAQQAEAHLRPWAALALRCGADLPGIHADLPGAIDELVGPARALTNAGGRAVMAEQLCAVEQVRRTVFTAYIRATSAALRDLAPDKQERSTALAILSAAIGPPAREPAAAQPEAERQAA